MTEGIAEYRKYSDGMHEEKIWLAADFRTMLIRRAIEKAGSVNQLGRILGYRSRVHPGWSVRQLLNGAQPFTMERLAILSTFLDYPMDEILKNSVPKRRAQNHRHLSPSYSRT
ncbi:MAG: hypothetical protein M1351_06445 [Candidatus Thermoplasmatota archaeon]|jgi:hypothetical protein|nr:hypothetical protein [Candidatus Sysuiplasma jiujiangense]MBX8639649.1 hypothetical protein [Candidatus Sysuiplasma jiujiangense]MBX8641199.1 hypothetical protein [Candidatus Sysuiplasma jiujiangense]MCL5253707.1 hypothetical protein [Candidatus Thermoplasmatota archaeon]